MLFWKIIFKTSICKIIDAEQLGPPKYFSSASLKTKTYLKFNCCPESALFVQLKMIANENDSKNESLSFKNTVW